MTKVIRLNENKEKKLKPIEFIQYINTDGQLELAGLRANNYKIVKEIARLNNELSIVECGIEQNIGTINSKKYLAKMNDGVIEGDDEK